MMRKTGVVLGALIISANCFAASITDIKSAILNNSTTHITQSSESDEALIYGGQDISRKIVATANESVWAGEQGHIG